jgi:hypothetical protein
MRMKRFRTAFHATGVLVVLSWAVLMGLLAQKSYFSDEESHATSNGAQTAITEAEREWLEIFMGRNKVGYVSRRVAPAGQGYLINEEIFLKLNLMDMPVSTYTLTQCLVDERFHLKRFHVVINSGVVRFKVSGKAEEGWIHVETGEGRARRRHDIKISGPVMVPSAIPQYFKGRKVREGESFVFHMLDPATLTQKKVTIRVLGRETVEVNRDRISAHRLESEVMGQHITSWIDDSGTVLKEEGFMGLTLVRSSESQALGAIAEGGSRDLYELAAVEVDKPIKDPSNVNYLKLRVKGLTGTSFDGSHLNGARQIYHEGVLEIRREASPGSAGYVIPFQGHGEMTDYLAPELNIESDDEAIVKMASDIAGGQKDPIRVSRRLMTWVYDHIEKRPVISVPSAVEVLRTRTGDCNEHATLLTALLRAAGIPARLAVGIVYFRGKFYYHAWTEAFLDQWVSIDPTLNQMPTDATHIRLVTGGLDRQMEIIGLIGKLRLEVMEVGYGMKDRRTAQGVRHKGG